MLCGWWAWLDWTPVVRKVDLHVPSTVAVGAGFQVAVTGRLADGTAISLSGENCGVTYNNLNRGFVEVDNAGHGVARKKGEGLIGVIYEDFIWDDSKPLLYEASDSDAPCSPPN